MSSNPIRLKYLFKKYLDNTCSKQDLEEFWQLMSELSENDLILQELQERWQKEEKAQAPGQEELDRVFERVQQKIRKYETGYAAKMRPMGSHRLYWAIAASLLLCMALGWWYLDHRSVQPLPASLAKQKTRRVITLPDGSLVTLNHDSYLDYPTSFKGSSREVSLIGEAYFDIQHDPQKPFLVHTGPFVTRVLGTAFNIKAYSKDNLLAVTVERGKVQVQREDKKQPPSILKAGDQLLINKQQGTVLLAQADVKEAIHWKSNDLLFDNIRYEEAAAIIGRHFNLELKFRNPALRDCRFTVDLTGKPIEEVLDILSQLTRSKWSRENDGVIGLKGEGCKNQ